MRNIRAIKIVIVIILLSLNSISGNAQIFDFLKGQSSSSSRNNDNSSHIFDFLKEQPSSNNSQTKSASSTSYFCSETGSTMTVTKRSDGYINFIIQYGMQMTTEIGRQIGTTSNGLLVYRSNYSDPYDNSGYFGHAFYVSKDWRNVIYAQTACGDYLSTISTFAQCSYDKKTALDNACAQKQYNQSGYNSGGSSTWIPTPEQFYQEYGYPQGGSNNSRGTNSGIENQLRSQYLTVEQNAMSIYNSLKVMSDGISRNSMLQDYSSCQVRMRQIRREAMGKGIQLRESAYESLPAPHPGDYRSR